MDNEPNADATYEACANSCPRARNKVCPQRCKYYLKAGKKICWNCFCKICNIKFNNSFIHEIQHNVGEGSNSNWQQNVGTNWEEGQASSSQNNPEYYNNWDEDVNTISNQLEAINLREQNKSIILRQIEQINSEGEDLLPKIYQNLSIQDRNDSDDESLLTMFNERILKYVLEMCDLFVSTYEQHMISPWTSFLCSRATRINRTINRIIYRKEFRFFSVHNEMKSLGKYFRESYFNQSQFCAQYVPEKWQELTAKINSMLPSNNNIVSKEDLQALNGYIYTRLQKGVKSHKKYSSYITCIRYLPGTNYAASFSDVLVNFFKNNKHAKSYKKLTNIGCESLIAISFMCDNYGEHIDCHELIPTLSIFSVEIFITTIFADGFDHLLGKWPFVMTK
ncbi:hypothetical protein Mgra_00003076 [Meloidogyne graminicola]|uniref:Uncharacterized protein n=1 Tax=Meloidogyne graminicola TaxID=189291 RepID=A0A8S9ZWF0_9BILA|nr:hypothetical protein Mgra_00003076 [Meloidogyne graminicola]